MVFRHTELPPDFEDQICECETPMEMAILYTIYEILSLDWLAFAKIEYPWIFFFA